jgi:NAD/NADP transhydrogenase beta subunit
MVDALNPLETATLLRILLSSNNVTFHATRDALHAAFNPSDQFRACCSIVLLLEVGACSFWGSIVLKKRLCGLHDHGPVHADRPTCLREVGIAISNHLSHDCGTVACCRTHGC